MLAEFSEKTLEPEPANAATETGIPPVERQTRPSIGRVLCIPSNDEADEIAAAMLAQLLEQAGRPAFSARPFPATPRGACGTTGKRCVLHFRLTPVCLCARQNSEPATPSPVPPDEANRWSMGIHR